MLGKETMCYKLKRRPVLINIFVPNICTLVLEPVILFERRTRRGSQIADYPRRQLNLLAVRTIGGLGAPTSTEDSAEESGDCGLVRDACLFGSPGLDNVSHGNQQEGYVCAQ
jgi:hypothetical protein